MDCLDPDHHTHLCPFYNYIITFVVAYPGLEQLVSRHQDRRRWLPHPTPLLLLGLLFGKDPHPFHTPVREYNQVVLVVPLHVHHLPAHFETRRLLYTGLGGAGQGHLTGEGQHRVGLLKGGAVAEGGPYGRPLQGEPGVRDREVFCLQDQNLKHRKKQFCYAFVWCGSGSRLLKLPCRSGSR